MKIAFVNQAFDRILPPHQGSVGICTYGISEPLAKLCEVVVYGSRHSHRELAEDVSLNDVSFRFLSSAIQDKLFYKLRLKCGNFIEIRSPVSTASWVYSDFGRRVALDIRQQRYEVVHLQQCSQYATVIRRFNPDVKIVLHLHAPWFSQTDPCMLARRLRNVDLITTVSDFVSARIRRQFPMVADRCETAYNGIDPKEFCRERDYRRMRSRAVKRVLFVGAVAPHSGIHILLDAFQIVARKFANVHLEIVGNTANYPVEEVFDFKDPLTSEMVDRFYVRDPLSRLKSKLLGRPAGLKYMEELLGRLPTDVAAKISVLGAIGVRPQLINRYYNADLFVFPPVCDHGFGLTPLEAMAAGTPVVASRSGAVVETIANGQTGLLVPKNDAENLAQAMLLLLENESLREEMSEAARRRAMNLFTWHNTASRTYQRYRSLMSSGCYTSSRRQIASYSHQNTLGLDSWSRLS